MDNKKGRTERHDPKRNEYGDSTDPLIGWHNLGKPSRERRRHKRGWKRKAGGQ